VFKPRSFDLHSGCRVVCAVVEYGESLTLVPIFMLLSFLFRFYLIPPPLFQALGYVILLRTT